MRSGDGRPVWDRTPLIPIPFDAMMLQNRLLVFFGLLSFAASCTSDGQRSKGKISNGGDRPAAPTGVVPQSSGSAVSDVRGGLKQQDSPPEEARSGVWFPDPPKEVVAEKMLKRILSLIDSKNWGKAHRWLIELRSFQGTEAYRRARELGLEKKVRSAIERWHALVRVRKRLPARRGHEPGTWVSRLESDQEYQRYRDEEPFRALRAVLERRDKAEEEAQPTEHGASNTRVQSDAAVQDADDADTQEEDSVE
jgi:hypothetical protein